MHPLPGMIWQGEWIGNTLLQQIAKLPLSKAIHIQLLQCTFKRSTTTEDFGCTGLLSVWMCANVWTFQKPARKAFPEHKHRPKETSSPLVKSNTSDNNLSICGPENVATSSCVPWLTPTTQQGLLQTVTCCQWHLHLKSIKRPSSPMLRNNNTVINHRKCLQHHLQSNC